jgi:hypothetical protein
MGILKSRPMPLTPEQAKETTAFFNQVHARAREEAAKDPNHPYNAYLWVMSGGLDAVMEEKDSSLPADGDEGLPPPSPSRRPTDDSANSEGGVGVERD